MAKIPFDIKYRPQIESGEYKLETECGHPASVTDWEWIAHDKKKDLAIKVLKEGGLCAGYLFDYDGKRHSIFPVKEDSVLFIITPEPEPELTEFEKAVGLEIFDEPFEEKHIKVIKEESAKLLAIAFREFKENEATHIKEFVDYKLKEAYEKGKADALKDLPRWEESGCVTQVPYAIIKTWHGEYRIGAAVEPGDRFIPLCMLEKLPGFKEN